MKMHIGYGGKYVSIYNKPLHEAKEPDRVCRFPRTPETEQLVRAMVSGQDALSELEALVRYAKGGDLPPKLALDRARAVIAKATGQDA